MRRNAPNPAATRPRSAIETYSTFGILVFDTVAERGAHLEPSREAAAATGAGHERTVRDLERLAGRKLDTGERKTRVEGHVTVFSCGKGA